jgi:tRNA nucleotidyltransferase/poly(A) polymerase
MDDRPPLDPQLSGPVILDRSHHSISRRAIDYDALKVLYRLTGHGFIAYLVGGAVRDLLLGRRPADFDIGTDAHPNQIKKLFRNAFLIGRRFRLAHIRFQGGKIIEVSTFRRKPDEEELRAEREEEEAARAAAAERAGDAVVEPSCETMDGPADGAAIEPPAEPEPEPPAEEREPIPIPGRPPLRPIAFGTPREDAFRRDITINALFYDISTYSVIDYVGGLEDLRLGRIRMIGDPDASFQEDPVRIWRVIRHASRLNFGIEARTEQAIPIHRHLLGASPGARLFEELNKDMKSGAARPFFELARRHALLPVILGRLGEFYQCSDEAFARLADNLAAIDASVARGGSPSADVMYALLFWPWAKTVLADAGGDDKVKALYEAFRECKPAATIPKGIALDAVQTLVIVEHMIEALSTGRMRWALRKRAHYAGASKICSFLVKGTFGQEDDPFARLFNARFAPDHGAGRLAHPPAHPPAGHVAGHAASHEAGQPPGEPGAPRHRRRRRRPRRKRPAPQTPSGA